MHSRGFRMLGVTAVCALLIILAVSQQARSQIDASPRWVPIGVSASGPNSTAWFHEPASRAAVACQTVTEAGSGLSAIRCISTRLDAP